MLVANTDWYLYNFRLALAEFLQEEHYQVSLVSPNGDYANQLHSQGMRWINWDVDRQSVSPWNEIISIMKFVKIIQREQPDLIHNHTVKPVIYGSLAARLTNVSRVVNTITGRGYLFIDNKISTRFLRLLVKMLYKYVVDNPSQITIYEHAADREYFHKQELLVSTRSYIIPGTGVDLNRFSESPEPDGTPVILYPGRILWDKGIDTLIRASQILKQKASVRVVLVGKPDPGNPSSIPERQVEDWVNQGIIEWWGWKEEMNEVYANCHVVVFPSLGEGMPTVLLEAAACGRPIVTTDIPGCRDAILPGRSGLLVQPQDHQALAEALITLVNDKNMRQRMGITGRKFVAERFNLQKINAQILAVYQDYLNEPTN